MHVRVTHVHGHADDSFDPDFCEPPLKGELQQPCDDPALRFQWSCTVPATKGVCRRAADDVPLSLGEKASTIVDLPKLSSTLKTIVVTVTVYKGARSTASSTTIQLSRVPVMDLSIEVVKSTPERLVLRALDALPLSNCRWNISGGDIPAQVDYAAAPYNDTELFVSTGWQASTVSLLLQSPAASLVLTAGATHTMTLSCTSPEGVRGETSYSWRIRVPPWGGTCILFPKSGFAMRDTFSMTCATWSAEELPIQYSFGTGLIPPGASTAPEISFTV